MGWTARAATVTAVAALVMAGSGAAGASGRWAPAGTATVHPGVRVTIGGVKCVAGYVFAERRKVFVGLPAACTGADAGNQVSGCSGAQDPIGLTGHVEGARHDATFVYSSWVTMQLRNTRKANLCKHNNLSLLRLDRRDVSRTNPSIPTLGGPDGVSQAQPAAPVSLNVYLAGVATTATAVQTLDGGWNHTMMIPGAVPVTAVGSPVLTKSGKALGMVTVIPPQGGPGETGATDLYREIKFMRTVRGFHHVHLVRGTVSFKG